MRALLALTILFCVGCAARSNITREKAAHAQLTHALDAYVAAHPRHPYPKTKEQLLVFATAHSMSVDLSWVTGWNLVDRNTLMVWYKNASGVDEYMVLSTKPI